VRIRGINKASLLRPLGRNKESGGGGADGIANARNAKQTVDRRSPIDHRAKLAIDWRDADAKMRA